MNQCRKCNNSRDISRYLIDLDDYDLEGGWIFVTDGQNYDDVFALTLMINLGLVDLIINTGGGFSNPGVSYSFLQDYVKWLELDIPVYIGSLDSIFDAKTVNADTFRQMISPEELFYIDRLWGARWIVPNHDNDVFEDFRSYIRKNNLRKLICVSPMTDVSKIIDDVDIVYQMGGRIIDIPKNQIPYLPRRKNLLASSNIYLDPIAANISLRKGGDKIRWVFSDASQAIIINEELVRNINIIRNMVPENEKQLELLSLMSENMIGITTLQSVVDAVTVIVAIFHDEVVLEEEKSKIIINDDIDFIQNVTDTDITDTFIYDRGIGGMFYDEENGVKTRLIRQVNNEKVIQYFYSMLAYPYKSDDCYCKHKCC